MKPQPEVFFINSVGKCTNDAVITDDSNVGIVL